MLSKIERAHLATLKAWVESAKTTPQHPLYAQLVEILPEMDRRFTDLVENVEWLVTTLEREGRPKARDLMRAVDAYDASKR